MFVLSLRGSALFPVTRNHEAAHSLKGSQKGCIGRKPVYNIEKTICKRIRQCKAL